MKLLLIILLFISASACAQNDSINYKSGRIITDSLVKVEILQVWRDKKTGLNHAKLKNLETGKVVWTEGCVCEIPYRRRDTVLIQRILFKQ